MVQQGGITYVIKRRGKKFEITKDDLKKRNLEIVREYKLADADRRGELLSEYYDLNKPFISYFPQFSGDYRDEIIATFITKIPEAFLAFDESRGVDVNSYLSMYYKKHAVREFLYLLPTVQYNKFTEDEFGKSVVEKAHVMSLDGVRIGDVGGSDGELGGENREDFLFGEYVFDEFLNGGQTDGEEIFLDGSISYSHYFADPRMRAIVEDFEDGLRYNEVMTKYGISMDKFLSVMAAIRLQLTRIMKQEGKDVRFITKQERSERRKARAAREASREASCGVPRGVGTSEGVGRLLDFINGIHADAPQRDEGPGHKAPLSMEDVWENIELGGEG